MKSFFLKIGVAIGLGIVVLTPLVLHRESITTYADNEPEENPYDDLTLKLDDVRTQYHADMNDLFNENIAIFVDTMKKSTLEQSRNILEPPQSDDVCFAKDKPNVSTYCVALKGTKKFIQYQKALNKRRGKVNDIETTQRSQAGIVDNVIMNASVMDDEAETARKALDTALQAYNEFRLAYPLHTEYQRLIPTLQKYRDALNVIRDKVETFPPKFIDATSSQCS